MSGLGLYRISQDVNNGYDTYDSAVVCAASEDDARDLHPGAESVRVERSGASVDELSRQEWVRELRSIADGRVGCVWASPEKVMVECIGQAAEGMERGVVCASFNAG